MCYETKALINNLKAKIRQKKSPPKRALIFLKRKII